MTVEVKQEHIDAGLKNNCVNCPIAKALLDCGYSARVGSIHVFISDTKIKYSLPAIAQVFIAHFDSDLPVAPFIFELETVSNDN